jgi:hypothetical protein
VTGHDISHILNLFKCACILYTPSNVSYNFKSYRRQEFLNMRKLHFQKGITMKHKKMKVAIGGSQEKNQKATEEEEDEGGKVSTMAMNSRY